MTEQQPHRRPGRLGNSSHVSLASSTNRLPAARITSKPSTITTAPRSVSSPITLLGTSSRSFRSSSSHSQPLLLSASPRRSSSGSTISIARRATATTAATCAPTSLKPTIASLARGSNFAAPTKSTSARLSASASSPAVSPLAKQQSAAARRRSTPNPGSSTAASPSIVILRTASKPAASSSTTSSVSPTRPLRRSLGPSLAFDHQHVHQSLKRGAKSTISVTSRASSSVSTVSAATLRRASLDNHNLPPSLPSLTSTKVSRTASLNPAPPAITSTKATKSTKSTVKAVSSTVKAVSNPPPKRSSLTASPNASPATSPKNPSGTLSTTSPVTMPVIKAVGSASASASASNPSTTFNSRTLLAPKIAGKPARIGSTISPMAAKKRASLTAANGIASVSSSPIHDNHSQISSNSPKLTSNITPRSGSRQNRVDSNNNALPGPLTPTLERHDHLDADILRRQVVGFASSPATPKDDPDAKFFYASDVNAKLPSAPRLAPPPKQTGFFYANGGAVESSTSKISSPSSAPLLKSSQTNDDLSGKFFYANGAPEPEPSHRSSISSSSASTTSKSMGSKLSTCNLPSSPSLVSASRPLSPPKKSSGNTSSLKSAPQANSPGPPLKPTIQTRPVSISNPPPYLPTNGLSSQRSSMDANQIRGHGRTGSSFSQSELAGSPASTPAQRPLSVSSNEPIPSPPIAPPAMNLASIFQTVEEFEDSGDSDTDHTGCSHSEIDSDSEIDGPSTMVSDSVINARSQRKVQDLEIRNASLEAINRTLERQLRKQQSELRRFRRLTRGGHLGASPAGLELPSQDISMLSDMTEENEQDELTLLEDKGATPSASSVPDAHTDNLDLTEDLDEFDLDSENDNNDDDSFSSSSSSNSTRISGSVQESKAQQRHTRDERRLHLDLSKHHELLIDSQKINQSLKRCLNWTEELIKEGRKALVYQVHVPDTKVGGRVLDPLDLETDDEEAVREYPVFYPRTGAVSPSVAESVVGTDDGEGGSEDSGGDTETETEIDTPVGTVKAGAIE
ncbi:hypothetical protein Cpir12675_000899 [Ceratocystis pirilliformis]|uniref:Uncharacterized protein n=1 Tax=Ceratocystis pirilliformis TaxID=259994 RepID=A0ABR3ZKT1_9PEZI